MIQATGGVFKSGTTIAGSSRILSGAGGSRIRVASGSGHVDLPHIVRVNLVTARLEDSPCP